VWPLYWTTSAQYCPSTWPAPDRTDRLSLSLSLSLRPWTCSGEDVDFALDLCSRMEVQRLLGRVPMVMTERDEAVRLARRLAAER